MKNFIYQNPTKIIFGRDTHKNVGEEVAKYSKKVLLHYGGSSIKKSGLYDIVIKSLKENNIEVVELGGVVPNPRLSMVYEGIDIVKKENIDFILAVGGGSVIDSAKAISAGAKYDGDIWDFLKSPKAAEDGIPFGTIVTLPATGSEMNTRCVITKDDTQEKRGASFLNPIFSIINAELCATLPKHQVAYGIVDMFSHCLERYFTTSDNVEVTDRLLEANMKTILSLGIDVYKDPTDYDKYAQLFWAGTVAHNYSLCVGRATDWASHQIEHEISGMFDVAHGAGLAVVFPAWMKYVYKEDLDRFAMFAVNVMNVEMDFFNLEKTALKGIEAVEGYFAKLDMPSNLKELGVDEASINQLALNTTRNETITQGTFKVLKAKDVEKILELAR